MTNPSSDVLERLELFSWQLIDRESQKVRREAAAIIRERDATIERLSAELERVKGAIKDIPGKSLGTCRHADTVCWMLPDAVFKDLATLTTVENS